MCVRPRAKCRIHYSFRGPLIRCKLPAAVAELGPLLAKHKEAAARITRANECGGGGNRYLRRLWGALKSSFLSLFKERRRPGLPLSGYAAVFALTGSQRWSRIGDLIIAICIGFLSIVSLRLYKGCFIICSCDQPLSGRARTPHLCDFDQYDTSRTFLEYPQIFYIML